jgi:excisionase family DNA binding protein
VQITERTDVATKDDIAALRDSTDRLVNVLAGQVPQTTAPAVVLPPALAIGGAKGPRHYLNVEQAAAYLGRTPKAIRMLVYRAEIPVIKIGRRILFDRERLDRWVDRHARPGSLLR